MIKTRWRRFAMFVIAVAALWAAPAQATVRYVDAAAGGGNNGTSWGDAYTSLVAALGAAGSGDELWVAQGTYNEGATIAMKSGVNMYGGFTSGMANLGDRNWDAFPTLLTGAGVRQVITGHAAILDGFIITNGAAATGAGMAIAGQVTTVRNCTFVNNVSTGNGGAVYNSLEAGDAVFSNCTFRFNTAANGGALAINAADPSLWDCTFFRNSATASGGAIHNENSTITLQIFGSTFTSNSAATAGGVLNQTAGVTLDISNCVFSVNSSPLGGVFRINGSSSGGLVVDSKFLGNTSTGSGGVLSLRTSPTTVFRRCVFAGNSATLAGGAVGGDRSDAQTYEDCIFSGNRSGSTGGAFGGASANVSTHLIKRSVFAGNESATLGGAIYINHSAASTPTPLMENCVLVGNVATTSGGGLYSAAGESRLIHATLANNRAATSGGAIYAAGAQVVFITNAIAWGNTAGTSGNEIFENPANRANVNYSDVEGGWSGLGGNNIDGNPLFSGGPSGTWEATSAYDDLNAQTALTDNQASWAINTHAGKTVNPDTAQHLQFAIASNTVNTLYVWGNARNNRAGGAVADVADSYQINSYAITSASPSKDTGLNIGVTDDIRGVARPQLGGYDRGAYEFQLASYTYTLDTTPAGLQVEADAVAGTAPDVHNWEDGSVHTINAPSPQAGVAGTQYVFAAWSDAGAQSHDVTATADTTLMASFTTQVLWTVAISPNGSAGSVGPADGTWHALHAGFNATATANPGWVFTGWAGDVSGHTDTIPVTMDSSKHAIAQFASAGTTVRIYTTPSARGFEVDGVGYTSNDFSWVAGNIHTAVVVNATQTVGHTRYVFERWEDGSTSTQRVITVGAFETNIVAEFKTQYALNWTIWPNAGFGHVTPASGTWFDAGSTANATAVADTAAPFQYWSGDASGALPATSVLMNGPKAITAHFFYNAVAGVIYVDDTASGANNGTDWPNAYTSLAGALAAAVSGDDIWVAQGTYTDGASFAMKSGVDLYGGFGGWEGDTADRDWEAYPALLDGQGTRTVVNGETATIDGFVITNGLAAASGGGMINNAVAPTVRNCTFVNNSAVSSGGAVYNNGETADAIFEACTFLDNQAASGGAVFNNANADPVFTTCIFVGNRATTSSAGVFLSDNSTITLTVNDSLFASNSAVTLGGVFSHSAGAGVQLQISNSVFRANSAANGGVIYQQGGAGGWFADCWFIENMATTAGGVIQPRGSPTTLYARCVFAGNSAPIGGVMGGGRDSAETFEACLFSANRASTSGGAIGGTEYVATYQFRRSVFAGNEAAGAGGALYPYKSSLVTPPVIENCLLVGNVAGGAGGALYLPTTASYAAPWVRHVTFSGNRAATSGGALASGADPIAMTNCIFWGDSAAVSGHEIHEQTPGKVGLGYSTVQGGFGGTAIISLDPDFVGGPGGDWEAVGAYDAGAGQTALTDSGASWTVNTHAGKTVNPDTTQYLQFVIASNTVNTLYVWGNARVNRAGGAVADETDNYQIHSHAITSGSPCKDTGLDIGVSDDIRGVGRPQLGGYDMGAYEFQLPSFTYTLNTTPAGLQVEADAVAATAPDVHSWVEGSVHTIHAPSPQAGVAGTQYVFSAWSDAGAQSHDVTATADTALMASFTTQVLWTVAISPNGSAGSAGPADGTWYALNAGFNTTATANPGWAFAGWAGDVAGASPTVAVTMDASKHAIAQFVPDGTIVRIYTTPSGRSFEVDGVGYTSNDFSWVAGHVHTAAVVNATQTVGHTRYVFERWEDGSTSTQRVITVGAFETNIVAEFKTQYALNWTIWPNAGFGHVTPASGTFFDAGSTANPTAVADTAAPFQYWSGDASGTLPGTSVLMNGPKAITAHFFYNAVAGVIYVDDTATGANDGTDWPNAYTSLASALAAAVGGDDIWVAQGTYTDGASFTMKANVDLYGGFGGWEGDTAARDWAAYPALLNGQGVRTVVTGANGALLDGFVITNGNAAASGGGMINNAVAPTVRNCTFVNNSAVSSGGAVYNTGEAADAIFEDCTFLNNQAASGGAVFNNNLADPVFTACRFVGNRATATSAGVFLTDNSAITLTVDDSLFASNTAATFGGVFSHNAGSGVQLRISNSVFRANSAANGGVIYQQGGAGGWFADCRFIENTATTAGGVIQPRAYPTTLYVRCVFAGNSGPIGGVMGGGRESAETFEACIFSANRASTSGGAIGGTEYVATYQIRRSVFAGNEAAGAGGAVYPYKSSLVTPPVIENCLLVGNVAGAAGGALYLPTTASYAAPWVRHVTFSGNRAATSGGALAAGADPIAITNCIFWGDSAVVSGNEIHEQTPGKVDLGYSTVQGGFGGTANISLDPDFLGGPAGTWSAVSAYDAIAGQTALTRTGAGWAVDAHAGKTVNPDTTQYLQFVIASNTVNTLYVWGNARVNRAGGLVATTGDSFAIHDYQLDRETPAANAGIDLGVSTDILGGPRPRWGGFDMGAYETIWLPAVSVFTFE